MPDRKTYTSHDMAFAALLLVTPGVTLLGADFGDRHTRFEFDAPEEFDFLALETQFLADRVEVKARSYANSIRQIKAMIANAKRGQEPYVTYRR